MNIRMVIAGLVVSAMAVVGCSSDGASTTTVPTTSAPPAADATEPRPSTVAPPAFTSTDDAATTSTELGAPSDELGSPAVIAEWITAAERGVRDLSIEPDATAAWGRTQQRVYQALARVPEWDRAVRALLPEDVLYSFDGIVEARRAVADHAAKRAAERPPPAPARTLPVWAIAEPLPIDDLLALYRSAEAATGVPWAYLAAIHLVETRMGRIEGVSAAGAMGPMQFLPSTWADCCVGDLLVPADAIRGAADYLVDEGAPDDMLAALYGYNPNEGYVGAVDAYARLLLADERVYHGFHAWEVYVGSEAGTVRLPVGYRAVAPVSAAAYALTHPDDRAPLPVQRP